MALIQDLKILAEEYKRQSGHLSHNKKLFHIFEGDLETYVLEELENQLNAKAFATAAKRVAPINILNRLVDKLSKIYAKPPVRKVTSSAAEKDQQLLGEYEKFFDANNVAARGNEFFNLHKTCALEPFLDRGKPSLRVLPADRFFVYSDDPVNPLRVTHFVKVMGKMKTEGGEKTLLWGYTDSEFIPFYDDGTVADDVLAKREDLQRLKGVNPYGRIPVVYVNRSRHQLVPDKDTDTYRMTTLIPVLLSDLNYAVMFQCFSIIWMAGAKGENLKMDASVVWQLVPTEDGGKVEVGVIKPEVDTDKVLTLVKSLMALWMQSRNIKPGAMGDLTIENAASGIAKIVDEMDTSEDRQKQVSYFKQAETELWELVIKHMHPVWKNTPGYLGPKLEFSPDAAVEITFAEQRPIVDSSKAIADQKALMDLGLQTKKGALMELYPDWTEEQIEARLKEVSEAKAAVEAPKPEPVEAEQ